MNTTTTPPPRCGNCIRWTRHEDGRMAGLGACEQRPVGHYTPETFGCVFNPPRWEKKRAPSKI